MTTYVLIPGAGGSAWYWHLVVEELRRRGRDAVAVDLPAADDSAGFPEYADAVIDAVGDRGGLVVIAQSVGGFTGPLVCDRRPVELLVLLNAMVPLPGEIPGDRWAHTGHDAARAAQAERDGRRIGGEDDLMDAFFHDVPAEVREAATVVGRADPVCGPVHALVAAEEVARRSHQVPAGPR